MLRLIALFFLIYIFLRGLGLIVRTLTSKSNINHASKPGSDHSRKPKNGNLFVDYSPKEKDQNKDFKGGDYVDYEEVE